MDDTKTKTNSSTKTKNDNDAQLVAMLLLVTFALLLLTILQYARYVVYTFLDHNDSAVHYARYTLVYYVGNILFYSNNAVNFFLYSMSGTKFRKDLLQLLRISK